MKKLVLVVMMLGMCVAYFFVAKNRTGFDLSSRNRIEEKNIALQLNNIQEQLTNSYPETAKEVIEKNDELMNLFYKDAMKDKYVEQYVEVIRMLYSEELLAANSVEDQIANIMASRVDDTSPIIMYGSEIKNELKLKENGQVVDNTAIVEVIHYSNIGDIERSYTVVKEDSGWKIKSWTDEMV